MFREIIRRDFERYKQKGSGLIGALLITIVFFYYAPMVLKFAFTSLQGLEVCYIYAVMLFVSNYVLNLLTNLLIDHIYQAKWPFMEKYRLDKRLWPWEKDPKAWEQRKSHVTKALLKNALIGTSMIIITCFYLQFFNTGLDALPGSFELMWQITLCMVLEDFANYWLHRACHHPLIYDRVHKKHHEFNQVVSISSQYSDPLEYTFVSILTTMVAPVLLGKRMHLGTFCCWTIIRQLEAIDTHTGYELSWCPFRLLPFSGSAEYHNFHHTHNVGNYSSFFYYWDTICGTNEAYFQFKERKE